MVWRGMEEVSDVMRLGFCLSNAKSCPRGSRADVVLDAIVPRD